MYTFTNKSLKIMNLPNKLTLSFVMLLLVNSLFAQQFLDQTLIYDGETREYKVYIPASYDGSTSFPLMFNFHGGDGNIASQVAVSDMRPIADTANFIIVYPQALADPNDGNSANWIHKDPTDHDDIFFVESIINTLSSEFMIDSDRVYACGYSLGGEFSYEVACRLNDKIAAVTAVARTMGQYQIDNCSPTHPAAIMTILGTDDQISPYDGLVWAGIRFYISADETHTYWANHNSTDPDPTIVDLPNINSSDESSVEKRTWSNGDNCVSVQELKVNGGGHDWPGTFGNMDIDASLEIWNFVSKYNIDGLIECSITSVQELDFENDNSIIYPNPVRHELGIQMKLNTPQVFSIYSTKGEVVQSGKINSNDKTINISSLAPNIYILSIKNKSWKFIKSE